jgi:hypothetical protein
MADRRVIYALKNVRASEPETNHSDWEIAKLGEITGTDLRDGLLVAVGNRNIAMVDVLTGAEKWRKPTHAHTSNLIWESASGAIYYADGKGLHGVERSTGRPVLDARLTGIGTPLEIRRASGQVAVIVGRSGVCAYNFKARQQIFSAPKLTGFFRGYAFLDHWPAPDDGQELFLMSLRSLEKNDWNATLQSSQLPRDYLSRMKDFSTANEGTEDAYESEDAKGITEVWWIDPETNRRVASGYAGAHHDVSMAMKRVFAVEGNQIWGAAILEQ